jgi:small subunit ribosomal protein S20
MYKSALKTSIKKFKSAVAAGDKTLAQATYTEAVSMVDKAVSKGILHENNAARKKSQYTKLLNTL